MKPSNLLETQPMDSVFQDSGIEGLVARLVRYLAEENHDEFGEIEWEKYKSWQVERRLSQFTAVDVNSIEWWELLSNTSHNYKSDYEAIWCRLLNEKVSILKTHNIIATNGQYITNQNDWLKICDSIQHPEQMQVLLDLNPVKEKLLIEMKVILLNNTEEWRPDFEEVKQYLVSAKNVALFSPCWMQVAKSLQHL